jgi:hypothetical protein
METPSGPIDLNEAARFLLDRQLEQDSKDNPEQEQVEQQATDRAGAIDAPAVEDREAEDTSDEELSLTDDAETEELSDEVDDGTRRKFCWRSDSLTSSRRPGKISSMLWTPSSKG